MAKNYAPCDLIIADIDEAVPDERVHLVYEICDKINKQAGGGVCK